MTSRPPRCLFVYPKFTSTSFWNYRDTCALTGAKYPAAPLGLVTVAAMLPPSWECRLVDLNAESLNPQDVEWADMIWLGGMISQQPEHLRLIGYFQERGKKVVVGGPDATSSPHLYARADHMVQGEAEVTLPEFLADYAAGRARRRYEPGDRKADMTTSPTPRFDLLKFSNYLQVGIQWNRGCPFMCEFCDIIELFGRKPRGKSADQVLTELQTLYDLGYRGHVDIVDDNFIGNKKAVKELLPHLIRWTREHHWPFEYSTEASLNLSDDDALMDMMMEAGFAWLFVGIETPDEATLLATQKRQNTHRSIAESVHKMIQHGMIVNAGYIVGFDNEKGSVAQAILDNIEATNIPVNMAGLLFALPNTQLTKRLALEGRLDSDFDVPPSDTSCQCTGGLNFRTLRPRADVLRDFRRVVDEAFAPAKYFGRVLRMGLMLNCSKSRIRIPLKRLLIELRAFFRMITSLGTRASTRPYFWRVFGTCLVKNPKAVRSVMSLMALYLHFGAFREYVLGRIDNEIAILDRDGDPRTAASPAPIPCQAFRSSPISAAG